MDSHFIAKAIDSDRRILEGIVSGAKFSSPMPFLWRGEKVGEVLAAKAREDGTSFVRLWIASRGSSPHVDQAWNAIKSGDLQEMSVGDGELVVAPAADAPEGEYVTRKFLEGVLFLTGQAITKKIKSVITPFATRLANVEVRTGALSMLASNRVGGADGKTVTELEALMRRIADYETRLKALENKPSLQYRGVWQEGGEYKDGDFATLQGSVWAARTRTRERPGTSDDWALAVKRGADGKDLR
jgi:hypothetical protein